MFRGGALCHYAALKQIPGAAMSNVKSRLGTDLGTSGGWTNAAQGRRQFLKAALSTAAVMGMPASASLAAQSDSTVRHTLLILNPGHFHAGLTLRSRDPRLADDVFVYAERGPDVENFIRMVESFNDRVTHPTRWKLHVYRGPDHLDRLVSERRGDIVVISGKNDSKMASIDQLHQSGFYVLGDKPWLIDKKDESRMHQVTATRPLAMDIMTERHQIASRLQRALAKNAAVFGEFRQDGNAPAIYFKSIHHLYKIVNNRPLIRPQWFFDTNVQGEGMNDVTTHLADLAQWMIGDDTPFDYQRDVVLQGARQWPTVVPLDIYSKITGLDTFAAAVRSHVSNGDLQYLCNAAIEYKLRRIPVQVESLWNLAIPEGGGDTHFGVLRGTHAQLIVDQGQETGFKTRLTVRPVRNSRAYEQALASAISALQAEFPGTGYEAQGEVYRVRIPDALRTGHETHFAEVLDEFLAYIESGEWPRQLGPDLVTKYTLLLRARELSHHKR